MEIKKLAITAGGAVLGNYVAEKFLLKASPDDPKGFVLVQDGVGMDDFVRAGAIVGAIFLLNKFVG
jgi:hypothetical protein